MNEVDYSWYEDRVEAFVDNDLPTQEAKAFRRQLKHDESLKAQVTAAHNLRSRLRASSNMRCPPHVKAAILEQTRQPGGGLARWLTPAAAALTLALVVAWPFGKSPSSQELAAARADLELALAYLDRAGKRAALDVGEQLLREGIMRPVQAGLDQRAPRGRRSEKQMENSS